VEEICSILVNSVFKCKIVFDSSYLCSSVCEELNPSFYSRSVIDVN